MTVPPRNGEGTHPQGGGGAPSHRATPMYLRQRRKAAKGQRPAAKPLPKTGSHKDTKMPRYTAALRSIFVSSCEP